jgi:diguanylate cyclase (GGDEF)-like protein
VTLDRETPLRRRLEALERENRALAAAITLLHEVANLTRKSLELRPTAYAVLTGVTAGVGLGLNRAMLFLRDPGDSNMLLGWAAVGPADAEDADRVWKSIEADAPDLDTLYEAGLRQRDNPGPLDRAVQELRIPLDASGPFAHALTTGTLVRGADDDLNGLLHPATAVTAPLRARDGVRGVLYADNRYTERVVDPVTELVFGLIADHAGRAIDNALRFESVARQARTDPLTGLGHHGALQNAVRAAVSRAKRANASLGVAMVDLDDFKKVNDTLGHLAGDALLMQVADRLRAAVRSEELPFRYGGEEFTVLLPGVSKDGVLSVGERLRHTVSDAPFALGDGRELSVTCSVGVAMDSGNGLEAEALLASADEALLRAKANGKNRVELG